MALPVLGTGKFRAFTAAGAPLVGGKLYTYASGTTTPQVTYPTAADASAATNANANPVILNSAGEADVWVNSPIYKFVLKDSNDVTLETVDGYAPGNLVEPRTAMVAAKSGNQTGFGAGQQVLGWNATTDRLIEWVNANSNWVAKYAGDYWVSAQLEISDTGTNVVQTLNVGGGLILGTSHATAGVHTVLTFIRLLTFPAGSVVQVNLTGSANTTVYAANSTFTISRIP